MPKIRLAFSLLILTLSFVFATLLMTRAALAQCTWMKGLTVVQVFNNVHDYGWVGSWDPCLDSSFCCPLAPSCALSTHSAYASNDPPEQVSNERPAVNHAVAGDTCPSAHDIDCDCHPTCRPLCSAGCPGSAPAPGG
jgi:hypothetical protein